MTYYKMPKQPQDDVKSDIWSIAFLSSVGGGAKSIGGAIALFDLFNRKTNRAHRMAIKAAGKTSGLPVGVSFRDSGYKKFKLEKAASFSDFHNRSAKLELKDRLGKSWRTVTIYQPDGMTELVSVEVNNWNLTGWHGFEGHGTTEVLYSDGRAVGNPDREIIIRFPKEELPEKYQVRVTDYGAVIVLPGDVLFDFDRDWLHYEAAQNVSDVIKFINSLPEKFKRIEVEGHTDSREKVPGYNMNLSKRRAQTVLDYFKKYSWAFDADYEFEPARGMGATQPVEPNEKPDGSDNPEGRARNRRVEIYLHKH